ncbi:hypothetical protein ACHAW5_008167 [Stephanodiscus triporus]|uniref:Uncharacterized protein n=1 Tax=Stephanodiscus triporus TaxID=2934178 RepID=A0ABD3Q129_9STRA
MQYTAATVVAASWLAVSGIDAVAIQKSPPKTSSSTSRATSITTKTRLGMLPGRDRFDAGLTTNRNKDLGHDGRAGDFFKLRGLRGVGDSTNDLPPMLRDGLDVTGEINGAKVPSSGQTVRRAMSGRDGGSAAACARAAAETRAREVFDASPYSLKALNELFRNVDERPNPTPCFTTTLSKSTLPPDLKPGCLLRIGPNGGSSDEGWLDGDGLVHAITLPPRDDEKYGMTYSSTYVDTRGRRLEHLSAEGGKKKKKKTFLGTLGAAPRGLPMLTNLFRNALNFSTLEPQKDTCNTAMAVSGSRVLALMEQSLPSEIRVSKSGKMKTIDSYLRLDGSIPRAPITGGNFGAHGRTCTITGERVHVSYSSASRPHVRINTFSENWTPTSTIGVDVPTPVMIHDLALTEKYVVVFDFPLAVRPARMILEDKFPVEYEPINGARIGLVPRQRKGGGSPAMTQWFNVEPGVVLHAVNAVECDDGTVVVRGFKSVPNESSSYILDYSPSFLHEWILDPTTGSTVSDYCLNPNVCVEFPALCAASCPATAVYGIVATSIGGPNLRFKVPRTATLLDSVVKLALVDDVESGRVAGDVLGRYDLDFGWHFVSEPTVVTKTTGYGSYLLLTATYVPPTTDDNIDSTMKSRLLILDGDCIANGPVTIVDLPHRVNYGLHSLFVDWSMLD